MKRHICAGIQTIVFVLLTLTGMSIAADSASSPAGKIDKDDAEYWKQEKGPRIDGAPCAKVLYDRS